MFTGSWTTMHSACVVLVAAFVAVQICSAEEQEPAKRFITVTGATWGVWSHYSVCRPSCHGGTKTQTRHCYEKGAIVAATKCSTSSRTTTTRTTRCTSSDCPTTHAPCVDNLTNCLSYGKTSCHAPYTLWAHENCKKYCGFCTETTAAPTVAGTWSHWSGYSHCSVTCGTGTYHRTRTCLGGHHCVGSSRQTLHCHQHSCPVTTTKPPVVNGQWAHWGSYTSCSHSCGSGTHTRRRTCTSPKPSGGGHMCAGHSYQTTTCHNSKACPIPTTKPPVVNGHWAHWSSYSTCSHSCGSGTYTRHRTCTSPAPSGGGHICAGSSRQTTTCHNTACVVNGAWGGWAHWSACSTSCGMGTLTRTRACNHPAPAHGGHTCAGSSKDSHECSNGPCPTWTHWFEGTCTVTCGSGTRERLRHCSTGKDADCTGHAYQNVACSNAKCV